MNRLEKFKDTPLNENQATDSTSLIPIDFK